MIGWLRQRDVILTSKIPIPVDRDGCGCTSIGGGAAEPWRSSAAVFVFSVGLATPRNWNPASRAASAMPRGRLLLRSFKSHIVFSRKFVNQCVTSHFHGFKFLNSFGGVNQHLLETLQRLCQKVWNFRYTLASIENIFVDFWECQICF